MKSVGGYSQMKKITVADIRHSWKIYKLFSVSQQTICTKTVYVIHLGNTTGYIAFINGENANLKSKMN